jgi:hypothetical protein
VPHICLVTDEFLHKVSSASSARKALDYGGRNCSFIKRQWRLDIWPTRARLRALRSRQEVSWCPARQRAVCKPNRWTIVGAARAIATRCPSLHFKGLSIRWNPTANLIRHRIDRAQTDLIPRGLLTHVWFPPRIEPTKPLAMMLQLRRANASTGRRHYLLSRPLQVHPSSIAETYGAIRL